MDLLQAAVKMVEVAGFLRSLNRRPAPCRGHCSFRLTRSRRYRLTAIAPLGHRFSRSPTALQAVDANPHMRINKTGTP